MTRREHLMKEQTTRLIREVRRHPCLWNSDHESFNDMVYVRKAWKMIANETGLTENMVKLKWKNLFDTFNRAANKNPHSATYKGDWPFFDEMLFLLTAPRPSPKKQNTHPDLTAEDQDFIVFSVNADEDSTDVLPHSEEYYDLLFLESLAPYFQRLEPVRRVAMRAKIQDMLLRDIAAQNDENLIQDDK